MSAGPASRNSDQAPQPQRLSVQEIAPGAVPPWQLDTIRAFFGEPLFTSMKTYLKATGSLISGGFMTSMLLGMDIHTINDIDIYVPLKEIRSAMVLVKIMGLKPIKDINVQSSYCKSFLKRNKVLLRLPFKSEAIQRDVDILIVEDDPKTVCSRFDLTCCQVWFDGETVAGTHLKETLERKAYLNLEYMPSLCSSNAFTVKRIKKYLSKGFVIMVPASRFQTACELTADNLSKYLATELVKGAAATKKEGGGAKDKKDHESDDDDDRYVSRSIKQNSKLHRSPKRAEFEPGSFAAPNLEELSIKSLVKLAFKNPYSLGLPFPDIKSQSCKQTQVTTDLSHSPRGSMVGGSDRPEETLGSSTETDECFCAGLTDPNATLDSWVCFVLALFSPAVARDHAERVIYPHEFRKIFGPHMSLINHESSSHLEHLLIPPEGLGDRPIKSLFEVVSVVYPQALSCIIEGVVTLIFDNFKNNMSALKQTFYGLNHPETGVFKPSMFHDHRPEIKQLVIKFLSLYDYWNM